MADIFKALSFYSDNLISQKKRLTKNPDAHRIANVFSLQSGQVIKSFSHSVVIIIKTHQQMYSRE